nr:hypothetical protein [Tanacetum cinerariifolium]
MRSFLHIKIPYPYKQQKDAQIKLYKTWEDKDIEKVVDLENKVKVLDNIVYKTSQSVQTMNMLNNKCRTSFAKPEYLKKAKQANPRLYDIGCYNDNLALMLSPESDERLNEEMVVDLRYFNSLELEVDSLTSQLETRKTQFVNEIDRLSMEYYYVDHMNAILGDYSELDEVTNLQYRVFRSNSRGKKLEVEEHRRNVKLSKNKMSETACNDSLNAKTLNVKSISAMCDKCVLIEKHDMCVKSVAKPRKKTAVS